MTVIRVCDFETTAETPDKGVVIEVGICDLDLEARKISSPLSWLCKADEISPETRGIHHISLDMVADSDQFSGESLASCVDDVDGSVKAWAAHNASFETLWFTPLHPVICTYKSGLRAWPEAPSHGNNALAYWLEDQGLIKMDRELGLPSHRAGPDAYVTANILLALFDKGHTGREMIAWSKEPKLLPRCPIGEHRGKPWAEVPTGFLTWMIGKDGMEADLKWNAQRALDSR